jgi:tripartite-type tricarboxylate transporter receptor subunit TctC
MRMGVVFTCLTFFHFHSAAALAEDYPTRPVRIVVALPAGTGADTTARVVGERMSQILGQSIIIENRPGAGSSVGALAVARSPNDGYTLLIGSLANVLNGAMNPALKFKFESDFAPVTLLTSAPQLIVAHPSADVKSIKELIDRAKAQPETITFGTAGGSGSSGHLTLELFKAMAGVKVVHVPYQGSPQLLNDLLAGRIQVAVAPASTLLEQARSGKIVAVATTGARRLAIADDIPTVSENGLPGFEVGLWFGLVAPAGTPRPVIEKLSKAANEALRADQVKKTMHPLGYDLMGGTPEDFGKHISRETKQWTTVVNDAGLKQQ